MVDIARIRKEKGLTQAQLAQLVGVTTGAIANWEVKGTKRVPSHEAAFKLAPVLGVSFEDFYRKDEEPDSWEELQELSE